MNPTTDSTLTDPQQIIADLQRELAKASAQRDEALARETATSEVLAVIHSSRGDLAPVFEAMLEKAMRLCDATFGGLSAPDWRMRSAAPINILAGFINPGRPIASRRCKGPEFRQPMVARLDTV